MPKEVERGYLAEDLYEFSNESIAQLQESQNDILYLLNRSYQMEQSIRFVGDHYQFTARQRTALTRASCSSAAYAHRTHKRKSGTINNETIYIDGFNLIILLETALSSQSTLLACMDGSLRDLCGLRGTYRIIDKTLLAVDLIATHLAATHVGPIVVYLDKMVSNSGRLKQLIQEVFEQKGLSVSLSLVPDADALLWDKPNVVTGDCIILDRCVSWINMARDIVEQFLPNRRLVPLDLTPLS